MADRDREPLDEDAAWAEIVAAYDRETAPAEHDRPWRWSTQDGDENNGENAKDAKDAEDAKNGGHGENTAGPADGTTDGRGAGNAGVAGPGAARSFTVLGAGSGPRDWSPPDPEDVDDEDDEHFVPPEPPPLPETDTTTKFGWLGALGGPLLLLGAILFQQPLTWWVVTLGVGGFLGGFVALLTRLRSEDDEDEDWDDPGRGAVV